MKILIADDSRTTLAMLIESLKKMGHEVISVNNGSKAIYAYQTENPDLIILDVIMEGMDGFECARCIRAINKDEWIPIIFLSGAVDDENIARGIDAGGDDYLTKPFSEITLASKIKAMQRIADMRQKLCETTKKLKLLSSTDRLTGLFNRLQFEKTIKIKTAKAVENNQSIALLYIDLDNFKTINDTLGHYMGDLLLQQVSQRLKSCLRSTDFIARLGGDEFAIILDQVESSEIINDIVEKLLYIVNQPYQLANDCVRVGASIGIAYFPSSNTDSESLVIKADIAMYHAKEIGRNNYQYFTDELSVKYNQQIDLKKGLRLALEKNELFLKFQPIFNLKTHKILRAEALVHWLHPTLGEIPAAVFIPLAEEQGLIDHIEKWVILKACQQAAKWIKAGIENIKLSINISPRELLQKGFPDIISEIIKEVNIPANMIEFELTETSMLTYSNLSQEIINKLRTIGVGIILDDFGTGYSSLTHLKNLSINAVKIDKEFINDVVNDSHSKMIIKSIIAFGNNLEFDVIAEGIEAEEQLKLLISLGCPQGQGYYLGKPMDEKKIKELIEKAKIEESR